MKTLLSQFLMLLLLTFTGLVSADEELADIEEKATHTQTRTIELKQGRSDSMTVNAFCLNAKGEILAAVGNGPGEIRVFSDDGKLLRSWEMPVKPEAINCTAESSVLAGGEGRLFHFTADGKVLNEAESPHTESLRKNTETIREEAIAYLNRAKNYNSAEAMKDRIESYEQIIEQLEKKSETETLTKQETQLLAALPRTLEVWKSQLAELEEKESREAEDADKETDAGSDDEAISAQVERMMKSKMRIASVSTDGESIFVATPDLKGYGFAVWKLNQSLAEGEQIVTGLSGCCGQMDVQACKNGLYVAENSRKRVVMFDAKGEEIRKWGKSDRTGLDGFTSCCNPMNVCFNQTGDVFTAESNTGRIKRFSADGEFLNFVGDVKLVPGCKNVSIAATPDGAKVYMLDLTRNHIVVMEKKPESSETTDPAAVSARSK